MVTLLRENGAWTTKDESTLFNVFAFAAVSGFILWRLSRKPRAKLLLAQGIFLAFLTVLWVGWFLWNIVFRFGDFWPRALGHLAYFLAVTTGMGAASIKCLRLSRALTSIDGLAMDDLLERLKLPNSSVSGAASDGRSTDGGRD